MGMSGHPVVLKLQILARRRRTQLLQKHQLTGGHVNKVFVLFLRPCRSLPFAYSDFACASCGAGACRSICTSPKRPHHPRVLVVLKLVPIDPVRSLCTSLSASIQHDPHVMQRHLAILPLLCLRRMNRIDGLALGPLRLGVGKPRRLLLNIDPQLPRQPCDKPVRPLVRHPQKSDDHPHQQACANQQPNPQLRNRNAHSFAISIISPTPVCTLVTSNPIDSKAWPTSSTSASGSRTSASRRSPPRSPASSAS